MRPPTPQIVPQDPGQVDDGTLENAPISRESMVNLWLIMVNLWIIYG